MTENLSPILSDSDEIYSGGNSLTELIEKLECERRAFNLEGKQFTLELEKNMNYVDTKIGLTQSRRSISTEINDKIKIICEDVKVKREAILKIKNSIPMINRHEELMQKQTNEKRDRNTQRWTEWRNKLQGAEGRKNKMLVVWNALPWVGALKISKEQVVILGEKCHKLETQTQQNKHSINQTKKQLLDNENLCSVNLVVQFCELMIRRNVLMPIINRDVILIHKLNNAVKNNKNNTQQSQSEIMDIEPPAPPISSTEVLESPSRKIFRPEVNSIVPPSNENTLTHANSVTPVNSPILHHEIENPQTEVDVETFESPTFHVSSTQMQEFETPSVGSSASQIIQQYSPSPAVNLTPVTPAPQITPGSPIAITPNSPSPSNMTPISVQQQDSPTSVFSSNYEHMDEDGFRRPLASPLELAMDEENNTGDMNINMTPGPGDSNINMTPRPIVHFPSPIANELHTQQNVANIREEEEENQRGTQDSNDLNLETPGNFMSMFEFGGDSQKEGLVEEQANTQGSGAFSLGFSFFGGDDVEADVDAANANGAPFNMFGF